MRADYGSIRKLFRGIYEEVAIIIAHEVSLEAKPRPVASPGIVFCAKAVFLVGSFHTDRIGIIFWKTNGVIGRHERGYVFF